MGISKYILIYLEINMKRKKKKEQSNYGYLIELRVYLVIHLENENSNIDVFFQMGFTAFKNENPENVYLRTSVDLIIIFKVLL